MFAHNAYIRIAAFMLLVTCVHLPVECSQHSYIHTNTCIQLTVWSKLIWPVCIVNCEVTSLIRYNQPMITSANQNQFFTEYMVAATQPPVAVAAERSRCWYECTREPVHEFLRSSWEAHATNRFVRRLDCFEGLGYSSSLWSSQLVCSGIHCRAPRHPA